MWGSGTEQDLPGAPPPAPWELGAPRPLCCGAGECLPCDLGVCCLSSPRGGFFPPPPVLRARVCVEAALALRRRHLERPGMNSVERGRPKTEPHHLSLKRPLVSPPPPLCPEPRGTVETVELCGWAKSSPAPPSHGEPETKSAWTGSVRRLSCWVCSWDGLRALNVRASSLESPWRKPAVTPSGKSLKYLLVIQPQGKGPAGSTRRTAALLWLSSSLSSDTSKEKELPPPLTTGCLLALLLLSLWGGATLQAWLWKAKVLPCYFQPLKTVARESLSCFSASRCAAFWLGWM